jgi:hypothetical protein
LNRRYEGLTEKNDPLVAIAAMVPFDSPLIHTAMSGQKFLSVFEPMNRPM